MAPRGRPRKRLSRMDAATDAMTTFGFDERLIQKTVKQLLKEYGGDDGWVFIEEYGYKELIEAILRDQESNDEDITKQKGVSSQAERAEDPVLQSILGPSGTLVDSTYNKAGNTVGETSCSELVNAVAPIYVELWGNKQDICSTEVFCPPPVEGDGNIRKDVVEGQISTQKELGNAVCRDGGNSKNQMQSGSNSHVFASPPTSSPCPVNYLNLCSGSHVQSGNNCHVSTPPPTASLWPVNHLAPPLDHHPTALPSSKGVSSQDERAEDPALLSTSCPSGTLVDAVEPTHEELCSNKQDIDSTEVLCLPPAEGDEQRCKDIWEDQTSIQKGTANVFCSGGGNSGSQVLQEGCTTILPSSSPCPVNSVPAPADHFPTTLPSSKRVCLQPPRRHFPCYGWIESDNEEDADDFLQLPPMKCVEFSK
ncbi:uncharacterized protein LOC129901113 [Solanum dulcamara]|uniref:uncharacterized protein LOC129901113 n=1 Tax=Solanum dulcamara TaxID=45834 RepID=UPI0024865569|nr:uncharacterized protein LOC129901113 [Solanum dulcamara]